MNLSKFFSKTIYYSFLTLFFVTPLLVSITSSELFEFPKMLFVYFLTVIIVASWLGNMLVTGKFYYRRTWVDIPLLLFIGTQLISTLFSLQPHTSWFGYYSRFHGGMFSTICYALLTWSFITHADKKWITNSVMAAVASASIVSLYGVAEHFGIDATMWVQDVQNRIFSTLGQPNWLGAWLGALLPFVMVWFLNPPKSAWPTIISFNLACLSLSYGITYSVTGNVLPLSGGGLFLLLILWGSLASAVFWLIPKLKSHLMYLNKASFLILFALFIVTILFTKSRSGILALGASLGIFIVAALIHYRKRHTLRSHAVKLVPLFLTSGCLLLLIGTEWTPSLSYLLGKRTQVIKNPITQTAAKPQQLPHAETVSDSTDIRATVWQGAIKVWQRYPIWGSGTETFAYAYYQERPREHNDLSEWDFLYNKAHNEYLNFLANNGTLGLSAIMLFMVGIIAKTVGSRWRTWGVLAITITGLGLTFYAVAPSLFNRVFTKLLIYPPLIVPIGISLSVALGIWGCLALLSKSPKSQAHSWDSAILASLVSIVITNFYGFSVVTVALIFFLLPAWLVILKKEGSVVEYQFAKPLLRSQNVSLLHMVGGMVVGVAALIVGGSVINYYLADQDYSLAKAYLGQGDIITANKKIDEAISLRSDEADYYLQKALITSQTAYVVWHKDASGSADLVENLTEQSAGYAKLALLTNPVHLNIYKSIAKVYLTLGILDEHYYQTALDTLKTAFKLSPTDPQLALNIGMLMEQLSSSPEAETYYKKAVELKPNYRKAWLTLGEYYEHRKQKGDAISVYTFVLTNIDQNDQTSKQRLAALGKQ